MPTPVRPLLLMIDDNPGDVTLVRLALEECLVEAEIDIARNAAEAFVYLAQRGPATGERLPNLILLDIELPTVDGKELLGVLRKTPAWRTLPVVVYSSSRAQLDREACFALGAIAYLAKPGKWGTYLEVGAFLKRYFDDGSDAWSAKPKTSRDSDDWPRGHA